MKKIKFLFANLLVLFVLASGSINAGVLISDFADEPPCQEKSDSLISNILDLVFGSSECEKKSEDVKCDDVNDDNVKNDDDGGTIQNPVEKTAPCN